MADKLISPVFSTCTPINKADEESNGSNWCPCCSRAGTAGIYLQQQGCIEVSSTEATKKSDF